MFLMVSSLSAQVLDANSKLDLVGRWSIWVGTGTESIIEITSQNGNDFTATWGTDKTVSHGRIEGNVISFDMVYNNSQSINFFEGVIQVNNAGNMSFSGTVLGTEYPSKTRWFGGKKTTVSNITTEGTQGVGTLSYVNGAVLNEKLNFKLNNAVAYPVGDDGSLVLPITYLGSTYLPVRAMAYLLGLGIGYDSETNTVLIETVTDKAAPAATSTSKGNGQVSISNVVLNGNLNFAINGETVVPRGDDGAIALPLTYQGTTYLPVRAMGYLLGIGIGWDSATNTVLLETTQHDNPVNLSGVVNADPTNIHKVELSYLVTGGNLETEVKEETISTWRVKSYFGSVKRGETIRIDVSGYRAMPAFSDPTYSYRPTNLKAIVSKGFSWFTATDFLVLDELTAETEEVGSCSVSYTIPLDFEGDTISVSGFMRSGYNFPGYPYGAEGDLIIQVKYFIVD